MEVLSNHSGVPYGFHHCVRDHFINCQGTSLQAFQKAKKGKKSMIALPIIQERHQEEICKHCEQFILGQSSNSIHFQCEGSRCEQATEMFYEDYPELVDHYEFNYWPSKEVKEAEELLDKKLRNFHRTVYFKLGAMMLQSKINILKIKINSITNEGI